MCESDPGILYLFMERHAPHCRDSFNYPPISLESDKDDERGGGNNPFITGNAPQYRDIAGRGEEGRIRLHIYTCVQYLFRYCDKT